MDPQAQAQLGQLEAAVNQFFATTDPAVKTQIEQALASLKSQPQSYLVAQQCLVYSANPYVHFFAVQVFEEWATRRWESLDDAQRRVVRNSLLEFYVTKYATLAPFVANKIAKVLSDIAKRDWPQRWPEFLPNSVQLASADASCMLGLAVLRAVLDEFPATKEDLPMSRKNELRRLLLAEAPVLRDVLTRVLTSQLAKADVSQPPPPDAAREAILKEVIECVHSFFSWAPFESILHGPLFAALLRLIARDDELSLRALTCVNEVMAKTFVPAQFGPFLLDIFQQVFALLGNLTKAGSLLGETSPYIEKLIEFTQLFVTHHFARAETSNRFPIMEFLGLLYQFTFMQPRVHGFLECLQIWETLVEFLRGSTAQQRQRYVDGLSSLAQEILRRIQFSENAAQLSRLSTQRTVVTDDTQHTQAAQSELGSFIEECVQLLGLLTELYPSLLARMHELVNDRTARFVAQLADPASAPDPFAVRDVETLLLLIGRLAEFSAMRFQETFASTHAILRRTAELAVALGERALSAAPSAAIYHDLATQAFGTLRAFCPWFSLYQTATQSNQPATQELVAIFTPLLSFIAYCANASLPEALSVAAFQLLNSLVTSVRLVNPPVLSVVPIRSLFESLAQATPALSVKLQSTLYVALSNALLLLPPQPNVDPTAVYTNFIDTLVAPLRSAAQTQAPTTVALLTRAVCVIGAILRAVQEIGGRTAKPIAFQALKDSVGLVLPFVRHSVAAAIQAMDFFSALFEVLAAQVGATNVQLVTGEILSSIAEPLTQLSRLAPGAKQAEDLVQLVTKFLSLLRFIAESSVAAFESFIPSILSVCVERILPLLATIPHTEMHAALVRLCSALVQQHPRLFFGNDETSLKLFGAVLEVFFAALSERTELAVITVCLETLNMLHEKQSLFQRLYFMTNYRNRYVGALCAVLFGRSHDLLRDELVRTLFSIVSCDFEAFFTQLLPAVIERLPVSPAYKTSLAEHFKGATDAPSFAQAMFALLNDFAYYARNNT